MPRSYSKQRKAQIIDDALQAIAAGTTLSKYCEQIKINKGTVVKWIQAEEDSRQRYACARKSMADHYFDQLFAMQEQIDSKNWQAVGKKIDVIKWAIGRLSSQYDDRASTNVMIDNSKTVNQQQLLISHEDKELLAKVRNRKLLQLTAPGPDTVHPAGEGEGGSE